MSETQRCYECDEPTGRCEDDTMYSFDEFPLCEDCFHNRKDVSRLSAELAEAKKECKRLKYELHIADYTVLIWVRNYDTLGKANATLKAELTALKEAKEACSILASITKTIGGMRDNASYEAEIAELKAEKEKADQIIKDLSSDRMLYKDMAERAEERMRSIAVFLVKILDDGMISRGVFAELMQIDRCDIDDVTQAIKQAAEGKV